MTNEQDFFKSLGILAWFAVVASNYVLTAIGMDAMGVPRILAILLGFCLTVLVVIGATQTES